MIPKIIDTDKTISKGGRAYQDNRGRKFSPKFSSLNEAKEIINPKEVLNKYNIKGFEFGNYVSNNNRYDYLIAVTKSLENLSKILKSKNIGMDNTLGIAFGARGMGGRAIAHYEPYYKMINLTRDSGGSALAHEFAHSLDYILGSHVDQNKKYSALSGGDSIASTLPQNKGGKLRTYANEVVDAFKKYRKRNPIAFETEYYQRRNEIFARMFEQYIGLKRKEMNIKDSFLSRAYSSYCKDINYLPDKEFIKLRSSFYKLFNEISKTLNS